MVDVFCSVSFAQVILLKCWNDLSVDWYTRDWHVNGLCLLCFQSQLLVTALSSYITYLCGSREWLLDLTCVSWTTENMGLTEQLMIIGIWGSLSITTVLSMFISCISYHCVEYVYLLYFWGHWNRSPTFLLWPSEIRLVYLTARELWRFSMSYFMRLVCLTGDKCSSRWEVLQVLLFFILSMGANRSNHSWLCNTDANSKSLNSPCFDS